MAYDPTKPANNARIIAAELRNQFTGLNDNINAVANNVWPQFQSFLTSDDVHDTIIGSSANNVDTLPPLTLNIANPPTQAQVQAILTRLNDLINALHH